MPSHGFAEPRPVSHGVGVRARRRNAPSLINVAIFRSAFDWDGRATTLADQLGGVFTVSGDMGIDAVEAVVRIARDTSYNSHFRRAYGRPPDVEALLDALVAFERSLVVGQSRFDRFYLGGDSTALSAAEQRGWRLFRSNMAGCAGCHVPLPEPGGSEIPGGSDIIAFRDNRFHNLGVGYANGRMEDVGRYGVTQMASDWGSFLTPSLNNVALTAPYMHDGSLPTLEAVIEFYAHGGIRNPNVDDVIVPRDLTDRDRADLVAFLRALSTDWLADSAGVRKRLLRSGELAGTSKGNR